MAILIRISDSISRALMMLLVALPFAIWGAGALIIHTNTLPPEAKANDVRLVIAQLRGMAARIEEFRRSNGRLPTRAEVHCDFRPCPDIAVSHFQNFRAEPDGTFILPYHSFGVMFSPAHSYTVTYQSLDGATDYDGWDQPWRWRISHAMWISIDILVIAAPWLVMLALWRWKPKPRSPA